MSEPPKHTLKIADTPIDEDVPESPANLQASPVEKDAIQRPLPKAERRRRSRLVQRVPPGTLDEEIRQINLMKSGLKLAEGLDDE